MTAFALVIALALLHVIIALALAFALVCAPALVHDAFALVRIPVHAPWWHHIIIAFALAVAFVNLDYIGD